MSGDGTYAPKSPDLSSFYSTPGPTSSYPQIGAQVQVSQPLTGGGPQPLSAQQSQSQFSPQQLLHLQPPPQSTYFPDAPRSTYQPHSQLQQSQHQLPVSPQSLSHVQVPANALGGGYSTRPISTTRQQYYSPIETPSHPPHQGQTGVGYSPQGPPTVSPYFPNYGGAQYQQQQPQPQPQQPQSQQQLQHQFSIQAQKYSQPQQAQQQDYYGHSATGAQQITIKPESPPESSHTNTMPPRRAAAQPAPPPVDPSPVKTKFPTARIKRIMQADEEVGKVAQQTPIAVGKALELFMVQLVSKSADIAREKSAKRVSAQMLKQVVETDDQWDFLREIVGRVENDDKAGKGGGRAKVESEESEEEVVEKKKSRPGRKKKA